MWDFIRDFRRDEKGVAAAIFALVAVAIFLVAGFALDMQRTVTAETRLQASLDAAALAAAKTLENASASDEEIRAVAVSAFAADMLTANTDVHCADPTVTIDRDGGRVKVASGCDVETTFASLIGRDAVSFEDHAMARAAITELDVAFMLDVSGSMKGSKLNALKTSASDAIDLLINDTTGDRVRVAFNTYATSVNAGEYAEKVMKLPSWMPAKTCVSERAGSAAWSDDAPGLGTWLGLDAWSCPSSSIEPLTSDAAALKAGIDTLTAGGNTAGHLGVAWAWYLISPEWADIWPAASRPHAYGAPNTKKAVVLMTDGVFNTAYVWSLGDSSSQAKKLCEEMRGSDILVYAVAFDAPKSAQDTLKACAGDADRYFEAEDGDELNAAYKAIASQLTNLSLTE
ncbi:vWA domain-containing protein [Henriciella aquimarina]|uniref:vWA domain-containing protein n=1 Tax=Henriciella aquimarina TaxID=545261 RepID=UPI0009FF57C3|nr:VWA domain-containing protein [Henriciella aquimarina]